MDASQRELYKNEYLYFIHDNYRDVCINDWNYLINRNFDLIYMIIKDMNTNKREEYYDEISSNYILKAHFFKKGKTSKI